MSGSKRILITGGQGFIGSALCNQLVKEGHYVVSFDNYSRKSHQNTINKNIEIYNGDIRNVEDINTCIEKYKSFDTLWHLAYINGTKTFYSHPELVLEVGVKGAVNTLDAAIKHNIKNYNLVSSSEVYNEPTTIPTSESERMIIPDVHNPRFSYSGGKIISELLAIHYGAAHGLNVKIFRPHNVYGENMGFEHVIPELVKKILYPENYVNKDEPRIVNIQGTGEETRSFCYIQDAVDEMILASENISQEKSPIYNIGTQNEIEIGKLVHIIAQILGKTIVVIPTEKTTGSCNRRCPSMKKLFDLGYNPKWSLSNGLQLTVDWYRNYYEQQ